MATAGSPPPRALFLLTIFLIATPLPSNSLTYTQFHTLCSLAHTLMIRVANLRASRGDVAGSDRARLMAGMLERGKDLGFRGSVWSLGWDYLRNYALRDAASFERVRGVSDVNELLRYLNELTRMESEAGRVEWVGRNYKNALRVSRSLPPKLLALFRQSGPLRELAETMQKEVVQGDLLRDCLELGSNDLKDLIQIFEDIALQYSSLSASGAEPSLQS